MLSTTCVNSIYLRATHKVETGPWLKALSKVAQLLVAASGL